ncbi:hypothetical protein LUD75_03435 [Epilithonimonas sp. JDS]|uniref:hypothetical protein n=1 Tax=Epilithonimonas sp. JDS TaxID=2902797 RepID=UPI001E4BE668|nr:hypothetical protein [Epilithonimonas sp. JDS]MCD9853739.1 hypothetical protein [Epilithonimonas sp. JDS]
MSINDILENAPENVKKSFKELGAIETQNIIFSTLPNKDNCKSYDFNQGMENTSEPVCSSTKIEGLQTSISSFYGDSERAGYVIKSYMIIYQILYKTKTIIITFNFTDSDKSLRQSSDILAKQILNTVVFKNLYTK